MSFKGKASLQKWPLRAPFAIARGVVTHITTLHVEISLGDITGHGVARPYERYGETSEAVLKLADKGLALIQDGGDRFDLASMLPAGAARNAIDCALWEIEQKNTKKHWRNSLPERLMTAETVGIDSPQNMALAAQELESAVLLKIKLDNELVIERVNAVRVARPDARLIIDANESWSPEFLAGVVPELHRRGVEMIEQPLPSDADFFLENFPSPIPIIADESFHTARDIDDILGKYDGVNIKLDKTGGLVAAEEAFNAATKADLKIMVGCMVAPAQAVLPILSLASKADWCDLDGPRWVCGGGIGGLRFNIGHIEIGK